MSNLSPPTTQAPEAGPSPAAPIFEPSGLGSRLTRAGGPDSFRAPPPRVSDEGTEEFSASGLRIRSAPPRERVVQILGVEDLTPMDLALLEAETPETSERIVKELRTTHHAVARYLVAGLSNIEIHRITGVSTNTVLRLKNSPAFRELMAHYEKEAVVETAILRKQVEHLGEMSLERLQEVLESEALDPELAHRIAISLLDRLGHGPMSTQRTELSASFAIRREELVEMKRTVNEQQLSTPQRRIVETSATRIAPADPAPARPADRGDSATPAEAADSGDPGARMGEAPPSGGGPALAKASAA